MGPALRQALKEWAVVVEAIREGRQILLLRKGGLHEKRGRFAAAAGEFLFFPTFEHQEPDLLKPAEARRSAHLLSPAAEEGPLRLETLGSIEENIVLGEPTRARRLSDHHVFGEEYVEMRIRYKLERPLHLLLIRAWVLPAALEVPRLARYAGCRSWVDLEEAVPTAGAREALAEEAFRTRAAAVKALLG